MGARSACAQEQKERQVKRSRQEGTRDKDTEMSELVEHGFDDHKATETTRVHIVRREGDMSTGIKETRIK